MEKNEEERRASRRYGMRLEVRWRLVRRRRVIDSGVGYTLDLSSGGVRFHAGRDLPVGLNLYLAISWPARLDNIAPMQLAIHGKILRSDDGCAAIRMAQHEFRTVGVLAELRQGVARTEDPNLWPGRTSQFPKIR